MNEFFNFFLIGKFGVFMYVCFFVFCVLNIECCAEVWVCTPDVKVRKNLNPFWNR